MNRILNMFLVSAAILSSAGCNKDYALEAPSGFSVEAPSVARAGQPVTFILGGNPDLIMFYSGEFQHVFTGRDVPTLYPASMSLSFTSETSTSSTTGLNPEHMYLEYSTDFNGDYTTEAVKAATWTDISDKFQWPTDQGQSIFSGKVCIDEIFPKDGSPVYFRLNYRVTAFDSATQPSGRVQWLNKNFIIEGGTEFLVQEMYNHLSLGWQIVGIENYDKCSESNLPQMPAAGKLRIAFRTQFKPEVDIEYAAVSGPVYAAEGLTIRDNGLSIKTAMDPRLASYTYTYAKSGEYDVTFNAINANQYGRIENPHTVRIKVEEKDEPAPEEFSVTASTQTIRSGEEVVFSFKGETDIIEFWSGEEPHRWEMRGGSGVKYSDVYMSFRTHLQAGDQDPLSIKYSSDYNGSGTEEAILDATWTDLSGRFTWATDRSDTATPTTNNGFVSSGSVNISDTFSDGAGPVYYAVFYHAADYPSTNLVRTTAYLNELSIDMLEDGKYNNLFLESKETLPIIVGKSYSDNSDSTVPTWNKTLNSIKFTSNSKPTGERWAYAVTQPIVRTGKSLDADTPETIKSIYAAMPTEYNHKFNTPGTYEVVFVGKSSKIPGDETVCKINIVVE